MPYATYRFNKIIAAETIRFIVTVAIVVYKGLKLVVYRMLTTDSRAFHLLRTRTSSAELSPYNHSLRHCADFDAYLLRCFESSRRLQHGPFSHRQPAPALSPDRYRRKLRLCHPRSDIRKETFRPNRRNGQSAESDRSSDVSSTTQRSFGI